MANFLLSNQTTSGRHSNVHRCLRRIRPSRNVYVTIHNAKLASFSDGLDRYEVQAAYGPWHSSGCWWAINQWNTEEWDVVATNNVGKTVSCLVVHDNLKSQWLLDAFYD
jgi:hypothetical protein